MIRKTLADLEYENTKLHHDLDYQRKRAEQLGKENADMCCEIASLRKENAELREKCLTRFERIKNAANADVMSEMLRSIYIRGRVDEMNDVPPFKFSKAENMSKWLQEVGEI